MHTLLFFKINVSLNHWHEFSYGKLFKFIVNFLFYDKSGYLNIRHPQRNNNREFMLYKSWFFLTCLYDKQ